MAFANEHITAFAVEATEFPDLARQYRVTGVPKTVVNDQVEILGGLPQDDFIRQALQARQYEAAESQDHKHDLSAFSRFVPIRARRGRSSQNTRPKPDQAANAIHSARVKLPGTAGTTFIRMIATLTAAAEPRHRRRPAASSRLPLRRSR